MGYSIELCKALVSSIEDAIERTVDIQWVPVTADSRIDAVVTGRVDLECGSTTSNVERQKRVAFSPVIFVAGTKVMVKWGSPISSFRDLAGRTVAVTAGTTNEKALRDLDQKFKLGMRLQVVNTHADGYARVTRGEADAFATDDVLLYGLLAQHGKAGGGAEMVVVGDYLSYDPTPSCSARTIRSSPSSSRTASRCWPRMARSSASTAAGSCASCPPAPAWICP